MPCTGFYTFYVAGEIACDAPGKTCMALRLHVPSKKTWSESSQANLDAKKPHNGVVFLSLLIQPGAECRD